MVSSLAPESRPVVEGFACLLCHGIAVRVVSRTERFLYLRCDKCGEVSSIPERRSDSRLWRGLSAPLAKRRAADLPTI
jgi:hypothetical protein